MTWRDSIDQEIAQLEEQRASIDTDVSPSTLRHVERRIAALHVARTRPVSEEVSAEINNAIDHCVDRLLTIKAYTLQTAPLEIEHANQALDELHQHLDRIHAAMPGGPEAQPEQREGIA